jgi:hypothetical protein
MTDERRDDQILGRALSRAIETINVSETPYEGSRIATLPAGRRFRLWQLVAAAAAVLFAIALGTWFTRPTAEQPGVAASPTALPNSVTPSPTIPPSPGLVTPSSDRTWVYFARDGLPPTGAFVSGTLLSTSPESRIASRITALGSVAMVTLGNSEVPVGASTALAFEASRGIVVRVEGDLATVEFNIPLGWGVHGSAQSLALLQQLVYTITEEPGIDRALITERGKPAALIDQLVVDKPLSREDVSGYGRVNPQFISEGWSLACTIPCPSPSTAKLSSSFSVDTFAPGVLRFVIQVESGQPSDLSIAPIKVDELRSPRSGKYALQVDIAGTDPRVGTEYIDRSPLRMISTSVRNARTTYLLGLDDLRPWRVLTLADPERIVVDLGGYPSSVSDTVAVYLPGQGYPPASRFRVSGLARTFEAGILWRVRDGQGRVVASGSATATLGTSQQWGTFQFDVQLPPSPPGTGDLFLEVYWASPKDGSDQGLVRVHLKVG